MNMISGLFHHKFLGLWYDIIVMQDIAMRVTWTKNAWGLSVLLITASGKPRIISKGKKKFK